MLVKNVKLALVILFTVSSLSVFGHVVQAAAPERYEVAADIAVCGVAIHFDGTAYVQEGNLYHVHYTLRGTDSNGNAYLAEPQVLVDMRTRGNSEQFVLHDNFNVIQRGGGLFSRHIADYNFHWVDNRLVVDRIRVEDSCPR